MPYPTPTSRLLHSLSLHAALPIYPPLGSYTANRTHWGAPPLPALSVARTQIVCTPVVSGRPNAFCRSEEHTSELQSRGQPVCRSLLGQQQNGTTSAAAPSLPIRTL